MGNLITVSFQGTSILAVLIDGTPHVSLRSICEALGLDFQAQRHRIRRHPALAQGVVITAIPSAGGAQQTMMLPLDMLNGWLFGISSARVRPDLRERLNQYQRECFQVLAAHFGARPALAEPAAPAAPITLRWLVEATGGQSPTSTPVDPSMVVGTWADIAHTLRHQPGSVPCDLVLGLAEAATRAAFHVGANLPRGPGAEIADLIRAAGVGLSTADLQAIASAATMEAWGRALAARDGASAPVAVIKGLLGVTK